MVALAWPRMNGVLMGIALLAPLISEPAWFPSVPVQVLLVLVMVKEAGVGLAECIGAVVDRAGDHTGSAAAMVMGVAPGVRLMLPVMRSTPLTSLAKMPFGAVPVADDGTSPCVVADGADERPTAVIRRQAVSVRVSPATVISAGDGQGIAGSACCRGGDGSTSVPVLLDPNAVLLAIREGAVGDDETARCTPLLVPLRVNELGASLGERVTAADRAGDVNVGGTVERAVAVT